MQVTSLWESAQGSSSTRETQNSSNARASSGSVDFAAILARKREALYDENKVIESDDVVATESEESVEMQTDESVSSSKEDSDVTRVEQGREADDDDDADSKKVDDDPDETWLTFSTERTIRNHVADARNASVVESSEVAGDSAQSLEIASETVAGDADLIAALQSIENDTASLVSDESSDGFIAALKTLADSDENAAALLKLLLNNGSQTSNQSATASGVDSLTALSNLAELTGASEQDSENLDLETLMKRLTEVVSKAVASQTDATTDGQSVDSSSTQVSTTPKSAGDTDARFVVGAAQSRNAVVGKAAEVTVSNVDSTNASSVEKVVLQSVRYLISKNEKSMTVQLSPPSLGDLRIEVTTSKSSVNVSLLSNNSSVRDVLAGHAGGLREALARSGVDVTQVAVLPTLSGQATDQQYTGHAQQDFTSSNSSSWTDSSTVVESDQKTYEKSYVSTSPHGGALNLFV